MAKYRTSKAGHASTNTSINRSMFGDPETRRIAYRLLDIDFERRFSRSESRRTKAVSLAKVNWNPAN